MSAFDDLGKDLRHGLRLLGNNPGFTTVAVLTLALGIGANAAIWSVVDGVLLSPLPYRDPGRLVRVYHANPGQGVEDGAFSPQDFDDLVRAAAAGGSWESLAAWWFTPGLSGMNLTGEGEPRRLATAMVSRDFFSTLGVAAARGRTLSPEENVPGADRVAVLSDRLWRQAFGADPGIAGRTVLLDGERFTVAGVMPADFQFPSREVDLWAPISLIGEDDIPHLRALRWMEVVGRLVPGRDARRGLDAAGAETDALLARLAAAYPESNEGWTAARLVPLHESLVGDVRQALLVLLGAVAGVLLIACANLANLLLARATARGRELAIRSALGAARRRLLRQLLTESLLLSLAGGAVGLLLAQWGVRALVALASGDLPRPDAIQLDARVAAFTFAVSLATGLAFGLLPALKASSVGYGAQRRGRPGDLHAALKEGGRGGAGRGGSRARGALIVAETAVAVVLLAASGLMLQSFWRLTRVDPGVETEGVLALSISIPDTKYESREQLGAYRDELIRRLEALPGVLAVGGGKTLPFAGGGEPYSFTIPGRTGALAELQPQAGAFIVTPGYFRALGIPVLSGRAFTDRDGADSPPALVVNRALARQVWPGEEAVGKTLLLGDAAIEVVGVVGDVRSDGLAADPGGAVYVPAALAPRSTVKLFVRTAGDPLALAAAAREAIWQVDRDQPISEIATLRELVARDLARPRFLTLLLGLFGALALGLAAVGLYGVIAYAVGRRTHEIGIRMALGAAPHRVLVGVLGRALALTGAGLALGLLGALATTRLLSGLLFGVAPTDPATLVAVALVLSATALAASLQPARRATRVDPLAALREE
jgi:predicted permease